MPQTEKIPMLLLHPGTPRDQQARMQLAAVLPGVEIGEPDETGAFDLVLSAVDLEDALTRVWNAIAASGTDDHLIFLEHPDLPEHRRAKSRPPGS